MNRPRVTEILSPYSDFSMIPPDTLAAAAERGTEVHAACAAYTHNLWLPVPDELDGYLRSFKSWFNSYVVEVLAVEEEVIHPAFGYVGHVDLIAWIAGVREDGPVIAVIDYKSPVVASRSWNCQIAAYLEASKEKYGTEIAGALMLKRDGSLPKMIWLEDENQAFAAFTGALSAYNYIKGAK